MKKQMNFNKLPTPEEMVYFICYCVSIFFEVLLIIMTVGKQQVSSVNFVIQCFNCILWIVFSLVLLLFKKG